MGTINETGHHKNVANFAKLIAFVENLGSQYNPNNAAITPTALKSLHAAAAASLEDVNAALPAWQMAVNEREIAFDPVSKLVTRVINALSVSEVDSLIVDDARTIGRKLQGRRAKSKPSDKSETPENESEKSISASQLSYDSRVENFDKLEKLIAAQPQYSPNEMDLQKHTLKTLLADLRVKNDAVINAYVPLSSKRIARDAVLYNDTNGLVKIAGDVKRYVKSVFGSDDPQFKQINELKFKSAKR